MNTRHVDDIWEHLVTYSVLVLGLIVQTVCIDCVCFTKIADSLRNPVQLLQNRDGSESFLIAQQNGMIVEYKDRRLLSTFIDISGSLNYPQEEHMDERGLLSFALHPNYESNGRVFVYYIRKIGDMEFATISEISSAQEEFAREKTLFAIEQFASKRNGGQLMFGLDGYLYISVGDGGTEMEGRNDLAVLAQDLTSLLGKILRVDVDGISVVDSHIRHYTVPPDNPYINDTDKRPEIFASGFRNAWRCSQDRETGRIFCGDTGSLFEEEIDIVKAGGNYGWNFLEGNKVMQAENQTFDAPIFTYPHPEDDPYRAVVGGYVYHGEDFDNWKGLYIYGDVMTGNISKLEDKNGNYISSDVVTCPEEKCPCHAREDPIDKNILSFGEDNKGELYVLMTSNMHPDNPSGVVFKLTAPASHMPVTCDGSVVIGTVMTYVIFLTISLGYSF
ncbi:hypothetical protein ScPMuIL_014956 [Solemya velum]